MKGEDREHGQRPDPVQSWRARRRGLAGGSLSAPGLALPGVLVRVLAGALVRVRDGFAASCRHDLRSHSADPPAHSIVLLLTTSVREETRDWQRGRKCYQVLGGVIWATSERSFLSAATTIWSSANRTVSFSPSATFVAVRTTVPSAR